MSAPSPSARARSLALELSVLASLELAAVAALVALSGADAESLLGALAATASLVALRAAAIVGWLALERRTMFAGTERAPSPRIAALARHACLAAWAGTLGWVPWVIARDGDPPSLFALATATLAAPLLARRARARIDHGPRAAEEPRARSIALDSAAGALERAAPAAALALAAIALAGMRGAIVLVPAAALFWRGWNEVGRERDELGRVAAAIARIEPSLEALAPPLESAPARAAYAEALSIVRVAAEAVRADADAKAAIEREEAVRARFMAAMGHELRSPLNSIVGFAQLLEDGTEGYLAPGQRESVVLIRRSAEDLLLLLTDVLDSARLDAGRLRIEKAWIPSVEIVTEAVRLGRSVIAGRAIAIEVEVQPGLPPVLVDRARIVQAVLATFRHAVRSTSSERIEVRARIGPDPWRRRALLVEVRDVQRALTREELERIFDSFRDVRDVSTGRRIGGLGLALALARKLVRLHGGEVWAESSPEEGTRYAVALRLEPSDVQPSPR